MEDGTGKHKPDEIRDYRDLRAWQVSRVVVKHTYEATGQFPREEICGLVQQMRRAAVSVASNIAEGYGRGSLRDYVRFLLTARGSLYELETQVTLAEDLSFATTSQTAVLRESIAECVRILQGLINSLQAKDAARK